MKTFVDRLDGALPVTPERRGITAVRDEDLRKAVAALRSDTPKRRW